MARVESWTFVRVVPAVLLEHGSDALDVAFEGDARAEAMSEGFALLELVERSNEALGRDVRLTYTWRAARV